MLVLVPSMNTGASAPCTVQGLHQNGARIYSKRSGIKLLAYIINEQSQRLRATRRD